MSVNAWSLAGRRALITGGSEGLGLAIAREFLDLGAHVALVARDQEKLQWRVVDFGESHPASEVYGLAMDLSYPEELSKVPAWLVDHFFLRRLWMDGCGARLVAASELADSDLVCLDGCRSVGDTFAATNCSL